MGRESGCRGKRMEVRVMKQRRARGEGSRIAKELAMIRDERTGRWQGGGRGRRNAAEGIDRL